MALVTGTTLENRYRIEELLGQGGMGAVYRAYDIRLQQSVAIKENTMAVPGISPEAVEASRHQFEREALMLARMRHPNLPRVSDHFVTPDGNQYLVMDYIEGDDLAHVITHGGPLPESQAVAWISQACSALEHLHTQDPQIIHRDIKPQNIKVTPKGQVFLVDFGIAKIGEISKTMTGALGMTPGFSPPEQYAMTGTDARSDVYALGATLYALLTGQTPPESISLMSGEAHLMPPQQVNSTVSPVVQQAVLKAMEPRKTDRPQSVAEFRRMFEERGAKGVEGAIPIAPDSALPPTQLMGTAAADALGTADKRIPAASPLVSPTPATPTPKPVPAPIVSPTPVTPPPKLAPSPIAPPKPAAISAYAERVREERSPLPLLWAGAGIVAIVLVVLVVVAISSSKGAATPAPMPAPTTIAEPTKSIEPTKVPVTQPPAIAPVATRISEKDGMVMVYVPAGEFSMGSANSQHVVYLDAFWIDKTEVTNAMFWRFAVGIPYKTDAENGGSGWVTSKEISGANWLHPGGPTTNISELDSRPAVQVSWNDAQAYCHWAGRQLPTEAQWEKAARGTDGRKYPWGNEAATCEYAVMDDSSGNGCGKGDTAWPVGSKPKGASPWGALDMAGNVWEWVADWFDWDYYANPPTKNPQGPSPREFRVLRGGGWQNIDTNANDRYGFTPDHPDAGLGFRCAAAEP